MVMMSSDVTGSVTLSCHSSATLVLAAVMSVASLTVWCHAGLLVTHGHGDLFDPFVLKWVGPASGSFMECHVPLWMTQMFLGFWEFS